MILDPPDLPAPPVPRLSLRNLDLTLGWRHVLEDVSFEVGAGELVGVLGPNGSGKSSLIRVLIGLMPPSRGTLWLDGKATDWRDRSLRAALGVVFQEPSLDPTLTAAENLELGARLFAVPRGEAKQRARSLLEFMELADRAGDPVSTFSGGMRRRLELARALIHRPSILVLDEPTTGLDPHAVERTWRLLLALRRSQGLTALVSTHSAEEAAKCDRLVLMDRGRVIASESPAALLSRVSGDIITLETMHPEAVAEDLREHMYLAAHVVDGKVVAEADAAATWIPRIAEAFPPGTLTAITVRRPSLADAFMKLTGRTLEEPQQQDVGPVGEIEERESVSTEERRASAESRGPIIEGRGPKTESRGPKTESREPKTENREPKTENRGPKTESRGPIIESREPKTDSREPKTESRKLTTEDRKPAAEPALATVSARAPAPQTRYSVGDDDLPPWPPESSV